MKQPNKFEVFIGYLTMYSFNAFLILLPCYINYDEYANFDNVLLNQLFSYGKDIFTIIGILLANLTTKCLCKLFFQTSITPAFNRRHTAIVDGMICGLICVSFFNKEYDVSFALVFLFVGNHIDFSVHREKKSAFQDLFSKWFVGTFSIVFVGMLFLIRIYPYFINYMLYFDLFVLVLAFIAILLDVIILIIERKRKIKSKKKSGKR